MQACVYSYSVLIHRYTFQPLDLYNSFCDETLMPTFIPYLGSYVATNVRSKSIGVASIVFDNVDWQTKSLTKQITSYNFMFCVVVLCHQFC